MKRSDFKYLLAYLGYISAFRGLYLGNWWSFGVFYVAFFIVPILEQIIPQKTQNLTAEEEKEYTINPFFDWLLYLHVPLMYTLLSYAFYKIAYTDMTTLECVGVVYNLGVIVGSFGINVGHELGHRSSKFEQFLSKMLLLPALYQHFFIEHNRGHHKNVATDLDSASARLGENVYQFWFRSVTKSYLNAWKLENNRLAKQSKSVWTWNNEMLRFHVYQLSYLGIIFFVFGGLAMVFAILFAIYAFLLLETVNYIEHYGLRRRQLANGNYEPVQPHHSWNSNHEIGRLFLYELTRHSDHHYKATRKYQILRHFDESPQLRFGYPLSMIIAVFPPLWFKIMNPRVPIFQPENA